MTRELKFDIDPDRPEEQYESASAYYSKERAVDYAQSNSMRHMQQKLTARALELIEIDPDGWILDLGCGTGFGQEILLTAGTHAIGVDVAWPMLQLGRQENGPRICADMTHLPFREQTFDAIISISAIQWILYEDSSRRDAALLALVAEFRKMLVDGGSIALQFYPRTDHVLNDVKVTFAATHCFEGQIVIDNPHSSKKRKIFLVAIKHEKGGDF